MGTAASVAALPASLSSNGSAPSSPPEYRQRLAVGEPKGVDLVATSGNKINYDNQHQRQNLSLVLSTSGGPEAAALNAGGPELQQRQERQEVAAEEQQAALTGQLVGGPVLAAMDSQPLGPAEQLSAAASERLASQPEAAPTSSPDGLASFEPAEGEQRAGSGGGSGASGASGGELASLQWQQEGQGEAGEQTAAVRQARASRTSQTGYQPPASQRLSAYQPSFTGALQPQQQQQTHRQQLQHAQPQQNSRPHLQAPETADGVPIAASPLQFGPQSSTSTTTKAPPLPERPFDPIIVCYLGSWSVYRPAAAKFSPENINPFLCTHLIYAFAGLSSKYELKPFDSYNDITKEGYRKFTDLKEHNKQLKTLIAVGGWNEGSAR